MALSGFSATNLVTSLAPVGSGSLREAIDMAAPGDTIRFAVTGTISLRRSTEFLVSKDVSILGPGAGLLTITGYKTNRIFTIPSNVSVLISDLTLADGRARNGTNGFFINCQQFDGGPGEAGGAITNAGSLTLWNCVVSNNYAGNGGQGSYDYSCGTTAGGAGGAGGAIYSLGSLSISNCTFFKNASGNGGDGGSSGGASSNGGPGGSGGAICCAGSLEMDACTFSGNTNGSGGNTGARHPGSPGVGGSGGAIWSSGILNARGCTWINNSSGGNGGSGGAIWSAGALNAWACTFSGDSAGSGMAGATGETCSGGGGGGAGGAICGLGTVSLVNCYVSGNWCGSGGAGGLWEGGLGSTWCPGGCGGEGGGIYCSSNLTMLGCTIVNNRSGLGGGGGGATGGPGQPGGPGGNGGGVFCSGQLRATNCTLTANTCGNGGGGSFGYSGPGAAGGSGGAIHSGSGVTLVSCTIVSNAFGGGGSSTGGTRGPNGLGAGVYMASPGGFFVDNIIAAGVGRTQDVAGVFNSLGHNLIGATNGSSGFTAVGDLVGSAAAPLEPLVGPLANNGGPTPTMALLPGSPAIDAGTALGAPTTDQRGIERPMGAAVDIGAFEFVSGTPALSIGSFSVAGIQLRGTGQPGQSCRLFTSVDLSSWDPIATNQFATDGTVLFQGNWNAIARRQFYRLATP